MGRKKALNPNLVRFQASLTMADVAFLERKAREDGVSVAGALRAILRDLRRGLDGGEDSRVHPKQESI